MTEVNIQQVPPNETIYIRNLNERTPLTDLKRGLTSLFTKYGAKDIVAHKNIRMRGQAFILFDDVGDAQRAMRDLQGYPFEEKPMVLQFAKSKSDRSVMRTESPEVFERHKEARLAAKLARGPLRPTMKALATTTTTTAAGGNIAKKSTKKAAAAGTTSATTTTTTAADANPPHKILFVQNLSEEVTVDVMQAVFGRYAGFLEVRMVPGRKGIAFVEYEDDERAIAAKEGTAGMTLVGQQLKVTYGKKV